MYQYVIMYGVISTICHRQIYIYGRYFTVVRGEMVVVVVVTFEGDAMHFKVLRRQTFFLLPLAQTKAGLSIIESDQGRALSRFPCTS